MNRIQALLVVVALGLLTACSSFFNGPNEPTGSLEDLEGGWIRVASNNPSADGIIVSMSGTEGIITDPAGSGYQQGDAKWANIAQASEGVFDYDELGSDYNYYDATMELGADDTLRITVAAAGAGNLQKWVREGEYTPGGGGGGGPATTQVLDCGVTEDLVLKNGTAAVDYRVEDGCVIDVTAQLTIEAGVVIELGENAGFGIYDAGRLVAVGTATQPIVLRGTESLKGWWRGIHTETNSQLNEMTHVNISDAGANYVYCCNDAATIFVKDGQMKLSNLTLSNGDAIGLKVNAAAEITEYSNIRIESHEGYPASLAFERLGDTDGLGSDYTGNAEDVVYVFGTSVNDAVTVPPANVPYELDGDVFDLTKAVVIQAGAEFVMNENAGIGVYGEGTLQVEGTASEPVIMRGKTAVRGWWRGIHMETNSTNNALTYLEVSDAGSNYIYCCNDVATLYFKDGQASLNNVTLSNGDGYGIYARNTFAFGEYANLTITTHSEEPLFVAPERVGELDGMGSDYSGNDRDFIGLIDGDVENPISWPKTNVPYLLVNGDVYDIKDRVDMEAGVHFVAEAGSGLGIYDNGIFNLQGSAADPIVFEGSSPTQGFWRGIHIETNQPDNIMDYVEVRHAGSNYVYCCNDKAGIYLKSGQLTVSNSTIAESGGCGIFARATATLTENNNTYSGNAEGDVCQ